MPGLDDITPKTTTAQTLFVSVLEELELDGGWSGTDTETSTFNSVLGLLGQLAQASAVEKLSNSIDRYVDTYQLNTLGEGRFDPR